MTHAIEPIRAAFFADGWGSWAHSSHLVSAGVLLAFDALCFLLAVRVIRRRLD